MQGATEKDTYSVKTLLDAVTATTTSEEIVIAGAKKVSFMFTRAAHAAGTSTFTVEVSLDGTTYVAYNKLISNVTNTNAQTLTRVASVVLAANGSTYASLDLDHDAIYSMKVTATEATDGTHTAKAIIER